MLRVLLSMLVLHVAGGYCEAQPDSVFHVKYASRLDYVNDLEKSLSGMKDSQAALDSLRQIIDRVNRSGDKAFAFQLGFIRIHIKGYMDNPDALREINALLEKGQNLGYDIEALDAKDKLANYYWGLDEKEKAMELALSAYKTYKNLSIDVFPNRFSAQKMLANWYYTFYDYKKCKDLIVELMAIPGFENSKGHAHSYILLGLCYRELKNLDSSLYAFMHAYYSQSEGPIDRNRASAAGNIGSVYYFRKEYDHAIEWVNKELDIWRIENNNTTFASFSDYTALSEMYLKKKSIDTAGIYLDSAYFLRDIVRRNFIGLNLYYTAKCRFLEASGNLKEALVYKDSMLMISDSINRVRNTAQIVSAEKRIADSEHKSELMYLEAMRKSGLWIRNFVIIAILFIGIIAFLLINRSRLKLKEQELKAVNEKNQAENRLLLFTKEFQAKNSQIQELQEELSLLTDEKELSDKNEAILRLQQSTILTDEQWDQFRILFEQVYSGFIGKVKNKFPGLTPAELRYLTLLKLELSNKEMANVLGVSMNTVHNYKSRMRRKFTLTDEVDFEDLIREI